MKENIDFPKEKLQNLKLDFDLILLNPHCFSTDNYIIDCDIRIDISNLNTIVIRLFTRNSKYDFIELFVLNFADKLNFVDPEVKKSKVLEAPFVQTISSIRHCEGNKFEKYFYKYINFKDSNFSTHLNQDNYAFYSINEENFSLYKSQQEVIMHSLLPNKLENSKELILMDNYSNLYCSHIYLDNYLLINYEREFVILREEVVLIRLSNEKINSQNIVVFSKSLEFSILGFYDNQMNIVFAKINLSLLNRAYDIINKSSSKIKLKTEEKMDIVDEKNFIDLNEIIIIEGIEFLKEKIPLEFLNQFDNGSNYCCMDSVMLNSKNSSGFDSTKVFALCGERGKSKLILYEKALKEIRLSNFTYNQIRQAILVENKSDNDKVFFVNTFHDSIAFYFGVKNGQIDFYELNLKEFSLNNSSGEIEKTLNAFYLNDNKTILHFTNQRINAFSIVKDDKSNSKKLALIETISLKGNNKAQLKILIGLNEYITRISTEDSDANILSIKHINSSFHNDCIFIVIILSNFKISILRSDLNDSTIMILEENTIDYYTTVSAFDIALSNKTLLIITGTYDNKLEILNYDSSSKEFYKKNECLLEAENSNIVPESIKIANDNQIVFVSTRIGKFAIFSLDEINSSLNFLASFNPKSDEIEPLTISDCQIKGKNNYELTLYSNNNSYLLELKFSDDGKNMTSKLNKYLVESKIYEDSVNDNKIICENYGIKNIINFFLNINLTNKENQENTQISIYQNNNLVCFSHFQRVIENSLLINNLKLYEKKALAKKMIALNDSNLCILYNENHMQSIKWKLHIININDLIEKIIEIETQNELKLNVMKTFEIEFNNVDYSDEENKIKFLILGGEFTQIESNSSHIKKGIFYIYKITYNKNNYSNLQYIKKYCIADPIYDLCQLNNNIILTCNNYIYSTFIEVDNINRKIEIIPKNKQPHMNKLISCESVCNSNNIIVGDASESFNLMEFDSKSFRFEVSAAELSLKTLYKGI